MSTQSEKYVIVLEDTLPPGVAANTAAILGITLGARRPEAVGEDVYDGGGYAHAGIIRFPVPILRGTLEILAELRVRLLEPRFSGLTVVDFTGLAQGCQTYGEYADKMALCPPEALRCLGIAVCGEKKQVNRLTGSLPLLR